MKRNQLQIILLLCVTSAILSGCGGGETPSSGTEGSNSPEASLDIGPEGGTVIVDSPDSRISGARVEIPPGALEEIKTISISTSPQPTNLPADFTIAGGSVTLSPPGLQFKKPVLVSLPYNDADGDGFIDNSTIAADLTGALYTGDPAGQWEIFPVIERDSLNNTVTISTTHFSTYLSYVGPPAAGGGGQAGSTAILSGEHFVANPKFTYDRDGNATLIRESRPYYYVSIYRWDGLGITAGIDSHLITTHNGIDCAIALDFLSCSFDAQAIFPKVESSGDATLWDWNCEYVSEHTFLSNYDVIDDTVTPDSGGTGIYCSITAEDTATVRINWGIDIDEELTYVTSRNAPGHMLAIRFWANHQ